MPNTSHNHPSSPNCGQVQRTDTNMTTAPLSDLEFQHLQDKLAGTDGKNPGTITRLIEDVEPPSATFMMQNESEIHFHLNNHDVLKRKDTLEQNPVFVNPIEIMGSRQKEVKEEENDGTKVIEIAKLETVIENVPVVQWPQDQENYNNIPIEVTPLLLQDADVSNDPTGTKPCLEEYGGDFNFHVEVVQHLSQSAKSKNWDFSRELNKLFIDMGKKVQLGFHTFPSPPDGSKIRLLPVYAIDASYTEPVKRCPNHASPTDGSNKNFPKEFTQHLLRGEHDEAVYCSDLNSGRLSLLVPYEKPQIGTNCCNHFIKFMCLGSDVGGINRRPVKVIFTLESERGEVLGRSQMDVRICSCPKRDKQQEEGKLKVKTQALKFADGLARSNSFSVLTRPSHSSTKKRKMDEMEEMVMVPVAKADFEKMNEFAEAAVVFRNPSKRDEIKQERKKLLEMHNKKFLNKPR